MREALRGLVCGLPALGLEPLARILDLRLDAGEVHTAQGDEHLMPVQHGLERDRHRSLRQGRRECWLAGCLSMAVGVSQLGLDELLCASGNRCAQAMLTEAVGRLGEVLTVAVAIDDVVR